MNVMCRGSWLLCALPALVYVSAAITAAMALVSALRSALAVALFLLASLAHGFSMFAMSSLMLSLNDLLGLRLSGLHSPVTANLYSALLSIGAIVSYAPNALLSAPNYGVPLAIAYVFAALLEPRAYATLAETVRLLCCSLLYCAAASRASGERFGSSRHVTSRLVSRRAARREGTARAAAARRRVRRAAERVPTARAAALAGGRAQRSRLPALHVRGFAGSSALHDASAVHYMIM